MRCATVTPAWLARHPLRAPARDAEKEARGRVLVVGGSREVPGGALLAALASLRAGAGKVTVVVPEGVATALALALPEARVEAAACESDGNLRLDGVPALSAERVARYAAVLVGPGTLKAGRTAHAVRDAVAARPDLPLLLDASAMEIAAAGGLSARTLLTPHAGELAHLTGTTRDEIVADPVAAAAQAAAAWGVRVLLKGPTTVLAGPEGALWRHAGGCAGLGTSGSGDVLAGAIAGIAATGMDLDAAAAWGVAAHARCGARLERRIGVVGYLARELADEVPRALRDLGRR